MSYAHAACLLLIALVVQLAWSEDDPAASDQHEAAPAAPPAAQPAAKPAAAAPAPNPIRSYTNAGFLNFVKRSAAKHGLAVEEVGTGNVRCLKVGGPSADMGQALETANLCLDGLETITGDQETFISKKPASGELYYMVLYATSDQIRQLIDDIRAAGGMPKPDGEDLAKKLASFPGPRCIISPQEKVEPILKEWATYSTTVDCLDAFYRAHDPKLTPPTWLREGLACDLQLLVCKDIRCFSIAYEDKTFTITNDWAGDIRKLIDSGAPQNKDAGELMTMQLDALPSIFYQQMWSLCSYVRLTCGVQKGAKSKMRQILDLSATGTDSMAAVKKAMGKADPQLTRAWRTWADVDQQQ